MLIGEFSIGVAIALAVVCFLTSMLSAIVGMAGGIILLSSMLLFVDPLVAVPIHAVLQLASNGSRSLVQRKHVCPADGVLVRARVVQHHRQLVRGA